MFIECWRANEKESNCYSLKQRTDTERSRWTTTMTKEKTAPDSLFISAPQHHKNKQNQREFFSEPLFCVELMCEILFFVELILLCTFELNTSPAYIFGIQIYFLVVQGTYWETFALGLNSIFVKRQSLIEWNWNTNHLNLLFYNIANNT